MFLWALNKVPHPGWPSFCAQLELDPYTGTVVFVTLTLFEPGWCSAGSHVTLRTHIVRGIYSV